MKIFWLGFSIRDADLASEGTDASGNPKLPVNNFWWWEFCLNNKIIGCRKVFEG